MGQHYPRTVHRLWDCDSGNWHFECDHGFCDPGSPNASGVETAHVHQTQGIFVGPLCCWLHVSVDLFHIYELVGERLTRSIKVPAS